MNENEDENEDQDQDQDQDENENENKDEDVIVNEKEKFFRRVLHPRTGHGQVAQEGIKQVLSRVKEGSPTCPMSPVARRTSRKQLRALGSTSQQQKHPEQALIFALGAFVAGERSPASILALASIHVLQMQNIQNTQKTQKTQKTPPKVPLHRRSIPTRGIEPRAIALSATLRGLMRGDNVSHYTISD
ncbi:hypothetical protein F5877DRAFT_68066 [Lentinula edodes]|nr:hypothetical protein F5877DRAFT_68066 [Lentinula edodes]